MLEFRTVSLGRHSKRLHIEAPGCIINVYPDLTDSDGRPVVRVEILADHYAGEAPWTIEGEPGKHDHAVRIVRTEAEG